MRKALLATALAAAILAALGFAVGVPHRCYYQSEDVVRCHSAFEPAFWGHPEWPLEFVRLRL